MTIDGRVVSQDLEARRWTAVTDEFWWFHNPGSWGGVKVYHGGVLAEYLVYRVAGVSGTLVARDGHRFEVSTTRSEILRERCALWAKARVLLQAAGAKERAARSLSDEDRAAAWRALREGEHEPDGYLGEVLIKTVHPRYTSVFDMAKRRGGRVALAVSHWSRGAEEVQREEIATVLGVDMAQWLRVESGFAAAEQLNVIFGELLGGNVFSGVDLDTEIVRLDNRVKLLVLKEMTRTERAALSGLRVLSRTTRDEMWHANSRQSREARLAGDLPPRPQVRRVRIGLAPGTAAWTDGVSYVAISRRRLARCLGLGLSGWTSLALLMRHDYAHIASTEDKAEHDLEFYQRFHDGLVDPWVTLMRDVLQAVRAYARERTKLRLKPPRDVLSEISSHQRRIALADS